MEHSDVIIVGGGPAGSTCARALVRQGARVTVVDRAVFPRDKLCTGWITPPVIDSLHLDLVEYAQGRVLQSFHGFRTTLLGRADVVSEFGRTVSYGIRRVEFDAYLLGRSGARVVEGVDVRSVRREGSLWVVNGAWAAPLLIGAGGHFCPVAHALNPHRDPQVVVARDIEVAVETALADGPTRAGTPELYFSRDLRGYGWVVVKEGVVSIGLGREDTRGLDRHVDAFVRLLKGQGRLRPEFSPKWRGHAYVLARSSTRRAVAAGALLVGDAAGLAATGSGEGIRTAIESGLLAAAHIEACKGDYTLVGLGPYEHTLAERLGYGGARSRGERRAGWLESASSLAVRLMAPAVLSSSWLMRRAIERVFLAGMAGTGAVPTGLRSA